VGTTADGLGFPNRSRSSILQPGWPLLLRGQGRPGTGAGAQSEIVLGFDPVSSELFTWDRRVRFKLLIYNYGIEVADTSF
jgi:hypothetical protein